jgi:hypothetical protein
MDLGHEQPSVPIPRPDQIAPDDGVFGKDSSAADQRMAPCIDIFERAVGNGKNRQIHGPSDLYFRFDGQPPPWPGGDSLGHLFETQPQGEKFRSDIGEIFYAGLAFKEDVSGLDALFPDIEKNINRDVGVLVDTNGFSFYPFTRMHFPDVAVLMHILAALDALFTIRFQ